MNLEEATRATPLIAILRGVRPYEILAQAEAVLEAGLRVIEVPLNSPDPFVSIKLLAARFGSEAMIGAGTVLRAEETDRVAEIGGRIIVAPNTDPAVIARAVELKLTPLPGVYTPSEAFTAIGAGARALKLFPAQSAGPAHLAALKAVLPASIALFAVGAAKPSDFAVWCQAGAAGFGLGSELYRPGQSPAVTRERARAAVAALSPDQSGA